MHAPGERYGRWVLVSRVDHLRWFMRCDCGTSGVRYTKNLRRGQSTGCRACAKVGLPGKRNGMWTGDKAGYKTVHKRLSSARGPARNHSCVDCQGPAAEWSYQGGDPDERIAEQGAYSLDLGRYSPRCVSCHRNHDFNVRSASHLQQT